MKDTADIETGKGTLAEVAYARLKQGVFDFSMPPGQRFSENELAALLEVSRTPLRLALHMLMRDGLIEFIGGHSAWRVRPLNVAYYEDLYEFRIELEAMTIRRLALQATPPDLSALTQVWRVTPAERLTDGELVADLDEDFHVALVELCGNQAMLRAMEDVTRRIRVIRRLDFVSPPRIEATYREHAQILDELDAGHGAAAERLIVQHIERSRAEIRKITLHHVALAGGAATRPEA